MNLDDMILISVDDHVIEPADLFQGHVPAKYADRAPRLIRKEDGSDVWTFEGHEVPNMALNAVAGRPREEYNFEPTSFNDVRKGTYDIHERVRDMDVNGVWASMCFPSMTGFCGQLFMRGTDMDLGLRCLQAYNDWHIADWAGAYPNRFIPMAVMPGWDGEAMAAEVHRVAALGCRSVTFSENPAKLGLPSLHSDHWDPFWQACSEEGTIVNLHIGSSSSMIVTAADAPVDIALSLSPVNSIITLTDLLFSRVLKQYPDLTIALSEGGVGWIPWLLDRCDYVYKNHRAWTGQDFGGKRPSDVFAERFIACFVDDPTGVELLHRFNIDNLVWECDYPHSDSTWPSSPEAVHSHIGSLTVEQINKITHLNAMKHYHFDAFKGVDPADCTVAALRATATDVVTTFVPERRVSGGASAEALQRAVDKVYAGR